MKRLEVVPGVGRGSCSEMDGSNPAEHGSGQVVEDLRGLVDFKLGATDGGKPTPAKPNASIGAESAAR